MLACCDAIAKVAEMTLKESQLMAISNDTAQRHTYDMCISCVISESEADIF